jgi:hypothetical protein
VEEFKYLGTNLTNQNSIQEATIYRLKIAPLKGWKSSNIWEQT